MWGTGWASPGNSHRFVCIFQTEIDCRQISLWQSYTALIARDTAPAFKQGPGCLLFFFLFSFFFFLQNSLWFDALQVGFLHFWREVFSVWVLDFLRLEMNLFTISSTARPSCTNSTSRTARSPTSGSKTLKTKQVFCHFSVCMHRFTLKPCNRINLRRLKTCECLCIKSHFFSIIDAW